MKFKESEKIKIDRICNLNKKVVGSARRSISSSIIEVDYSYRYKGILMNSSRVYAFSHIQPTFDEKLYQCLQLCQKGEGQAYCFVNPNKPHDSVLNKKLDSVYFFRIFLTILFIIASIYLFYCARFEQRLSH